MRKQLTKNEIDLFRADTYLILANLFYETPTEKILKLLRSGNYSINTRDPWVECWAELVNETRKHNEKAIKKEFHKLFIGVNRGELLPYASWYLAGYLHEKPLMELRSELRSLGIKSSGTSPEPEDHISMLCEAMSILIENREAKQKLFFFKFISTWVNTFFEDVIRSQSSNFYRAVGSFGKKFILTEQQYLNIDN